MNSANQFALVTGANRGIGYEVCRQLAKLGYTVFLTARSLDKARQAVERLGETNIVPLALDISRLESIVAAFAEVSRHTDVLDVLINNAAIDYDTDQQVLSADLVRVRRVFETNTMGAWQMVQTFLPLLQKSNHGRIVNVSSGAGALGSLSSGTPAYSLSKAALNALTIMMARALESQKILVNAVCPGWVATDMGGAGGRPIKDGAASVVFAAELKKNGPTGGFFRDGKQISW